MLSFFEGGHNGKLQANTVKRLLFTAFEFRDSYTKKWLAAFYISERPNVVSDFMCKLHVTYILVAFHICEMIVLANIARIKRLQIKNGLQYLNWVVSISTITTYFSLKKLKIIPYQFHRRQWSSWFPRSTGLFSWAWCPGRPPCHSCSRCGTSRRACPPWWNRLPTWWSHPTPTQNLQQKVIQW